MLLLNIATKWGGGHYSYGHNYPGWFYIVAVFVVLIAFICGKLKIGNKK